ncbi:MAG: phosphoribosylamine--glycine ligase [Gammaproteobacteria bacterium]|nr:phosphoribosylamine--glycine ligase [Gammaproteobacteria bacterium]
MTTILLIGSGAREHAIAKAINASPQSTKLLCFASQRNPGILPLATTYQIGSLTAGKQVVAFARAQQADFAIIGPEAPLASGVADQLAAAGIAAIGPKKALAQLESSKAFTRDLLSRHHIDASPGYRQFNSMEGITDCLKQWPQCYVIKADGLMGGKGVKLFGDHLHSDEEALAYCQKLIAAGSSLVIEERLIGQEFSLISLTDGISLCHTPAIQDHKRAFVGDRGPNTGGMGSYSAANHRLPFLSAEDISAAKAINEATLQALKQEFSERYIGFLYGGFIATAEGVKLIEYNARLGDPEALNLLALLQSDFVALCQAMVAGTLDQIEAEFAHQASVCKYLVPEGYPDQPLKDAQVNISAVTAPQQLLFGAIDERDDKLYETGSRTLAVVACADTIDAAERLVETEIANIRGPLFHRPDIGTAALINQRIEQMNQLRHGNLPFIAAAKNTRPIRLAVLGSTRGTVMQTLITAINQQQLAAEIAIVISNRADALILQRATAAGLEAQFIDPAELSRQQYDEKIAQILSQYPVDLIVLIGYMRILSPAFVSQWHHRIINIHPSLLPAHSGLINEAVHRAVLQAGDNESGCTIHYVNEEVDNGEIIIQKRCAVSANDSVDSLKSKVQTLEGAAYIEAIQQIQRQLVLT